jgi:hypothetical protein
VTPQSLLCTRGTDFLRVFGDQGAMKVRVGELVACHPASS